MQDSASGIVQFPWRVGFELRPLPAVDNAPVDSLAEQFLARCFAANLEARGPVGQGDALRTPVELSRVGDTTVAATPSQAGQNSPLAQAEKMKKRDERKRRLALLASQERELLREAQARVEEQSAMARLIQLQQLRDAPPLPKPAPNVSREQLENEVRLAAAEERQRLAALVARQESSAARVPKVEVCPFFLEACEDT
jgi:hypothetical protein